MRFTQKKFSFDSIKYAVIHFILSCLIFLVVAFVSQRINFLLNLSGLYPERTLFTVFGLIFGLPGIFGSITANLIYLFSSGISTFGCLLAIPMNFLSGFLPLLIWKIFIKDDGFFRFRINTLKKLLIFLGITVFISLINCLFTGIYESFIIENVFHSMETLISFMNGMVFTFFPGLIIIIASSFLYQIDKMRGNSTNKTEIQELSVFENFLLIFSVFSVILFAIIGSKEYIEYRQISLSPLEASERILITLMILLIIMTIFGIISSIFIQLKVSPLSDENCYKSENCENSKTDGKKNRFPEKFDNEKRIVFAKQVKNTLLPQLFPTFTPCSDVDIFASIKFSKDFGGDFYDFFTVDQTHLAFMIADVTGRGVEAALFLSIVKNLLKDKMQAGFLPEETFSDINLQLCKDNFAGLFVSVWAGLLNTENGELKYINAGQPFPILIKKNQFSKILESSVDLALGVSDETLYSSNVIQLEPGDKLALYTRGVTEAENIDKKTYGSQRLCSFLEKYKEIEVQEIVEGLIRDIAIFSGSNDSENDMTVLALEYKKS